MASSDYYLCPVCDQKALYDGAEAASYVVVLHPDCFEQAKTEAAESALRDAAAGLEDGGHGVAAMAIRIGINLAAAVAEEQP